MEGGKSWCQKEEEETLLSQTRENVWSHGGWGKSGVLV